MERLREHIFLVLRQELEHWKERLGIYACHSRKQSSGVCGGGASLWFAAGWNIDSKTLAGLKTGVLEVSTF